MRTQLLNPEYTTSVLIDGVEMVIRRISHTYNWRGTAGLLHNPIKPDSLCKAGELYLPFVRQQKVKRPKDPKVRVPLDFKPRLGPSTHLYTEMTASKFVFSVFPAELYSRTQQFAEFDRRGMMVADRLNRWKQISLEEQIETIDLLVEMGLKLVEAINIFKWDAGRHYLLAATLTDALNRVGNTPAMAAKVLGSVRREKTEGEQLERNKRANTFRQGIVSNLTFMRESDLSIVAGWLESDVTDKSVHIIRSNTQRYLAIKPWAHWSAFAEWALDQGPADFVLLRKALVSETILIQAEAHWSSGLAAEFSEVVKELLDRVIDIGVEPYVQIARVLLYYHELDDYQAARDAYRERYVPEMPETVVWLPKHLRQVYQAA